MRLLNTLSLKMMAASLLMAGLLTACATQPNEVHSAQDTSTPSSQRKIAARQQRQLSPVPAFSGSGPGWRIEIQATGNMQHTFRLSASDSVVKATGTLAYHGPVTDAPSGLIVLSGQRNDIQAADGSVIVEIQPKDCTDASGRQYQHSVSIHAASLAVQGLANIQGCGDLAVY